MFALQVYLVHPDGTHQRRLGPLQFGATIDSLSWRPDGSQLLLIPNWKGFGCLQAYDVAADSWSEPYGERAMWAAVYSPEGNRIAALVEGGASSAEGARGGYIPHPRHLTVINLRTEEERTLTVPGVSDLALAQPTWSPDGDWLACAYRWSGETWDTYLLAADGSESRLLKADAADPAWSPTASSSTPTPSPTVTLKPSGLTSGAVRLGQIVTASGTVTPVSLACTRVVLSVQMKTGATWVKVTTAPASSRPVGNYRWQHTPALKGAYRMRAQRAASAACPAATTPWRAFTVK